MMHLSDRYLSAYAALRRFEAMCARLVESRRAWRALADRFDLIAEHGGDLGDLSEATLRAYASAAWGRSIGSPR